jgi:lipopolysaccharide transport system ATP-binding protein
MSDFAIKADGLSKQYRLGGQQEKYKTLRDTLMDACAAPLRRLSAALRGRSEAAPTFWALRDISFEIARGDVVGVIGRNGAGKSTLLKILSRITEPTRGHAEVRGRVRSLLEVGTGFHNELTGRENIFLNGAILGMRRAEIARKFDEIVNFAEVEQFIDTPVKRYSSGMYLRLAFAVAAHLEPEILLVDEVLAVGDAQFQKKCLGKMGEVAQQGRTVLFVSHNMSAVKELCRHGILLDAGQIAFQGDAAKCIGEYLRRLEEQPAPREQGAQRLVTGPLRAHSRAASGIIAGEPFTVTLPLNARELRNPTLFFIVEDFTGATVVHSRTSSRELGAEVLNGACQLELAMPALWLAPGVYSAYFKFLATDSDRATGRFVSEKMMLEVHGQFGHHGKAMLAPQVAWHIVPHNAKSQHA